QGEKDHGEGFGMALSSTSRRAICTGDDHDVGTSNDNRQGRIDACIVNSTTTQTLDGLMDFKSFDTDGMTFTIDDQFGVDIRVHYLALGGDSITDSAIVTWDPTGTGNQSYTALGFQPDFLLMTHVAFNGDNFLTNNRAMTIGVVTGSANEGVMCTGGDDNEVTSNTHSYCITSECTAACHTANLVNKRGSFVSFNSNGWTVNFTDTGGSIHMYCLALKGGNYSVGNLQTKTDGTDIAVTGLGFNPSAVLFLSNGNAEDTTGNESNHTSWSVGAASSATDRGAQGAFSKDAVGTTECATAIEFDAVYINQSTADPIVTEGLMDIKSFDSDGFTCVMDDADPSAALVLYAAFGPAASEITPTVGAGVLSGVASTMDLGMEPGTMIRGT
ncbi:MAG: hypothetical protein ACE5NA_10965, partial [Nitrospiraceae bacterium]